MTYTWGAVEGPAVIHRICLPCPEVKISVSEPRVQLKAPRGYGAHLNSRKRFDLQSFRLRNLLGAYRHIKTKASDERPPGRRSARAER